MFFRNVISESGASILGSIALLATQVVLARVLPVPVFAALLTATAIIGISEVFSDFGLRIVGTRAFAIHNTNPNTLFMATSILKLANGIFLTTILLIWPSHVLDWEAMILVGVVAATQFSTDPFIWFFRGRERMDISAGLIVTWRLLNMGAMIGAAYVGGGVTLLLMVWAVTNLVRIAVAFVILRRNFVPEVNLQISRAVVTKSLKLSRQAFPIGIAFVSVALYNRLGVLLLSRFGTDQDVAVYGIAFTLVASSAFIATAITNASFPRIARAISSGDWIIAVQHYNRNARLISQVFMPLCLGGIVLATWAVHLLYPPQMSEAANAIILLLPGLFLSNINLSLKFFMNAAGKNWLELLSVLLGVVVFSGLLIIEVGPTLFESAAIAWGLSELSIFFIKLFFLSRTRPINGIRWGAQLLGFLALTVASFTRLYLFS